MVNGLIQTLMTFEFPDFNSRAYDYTGAVLFEFGDKLICLGSSSRDNDGAAGKRLRFGSNRIVFGGLSHQSAKLYGFGVQALTWSQIRDDLPRFLTNHA